MRNSLVVECAWGIVEFLWNHSRLGRNRGQLQGRRAQAGRALSRLGTEGGARHAQRETACELRKYSVPHQTLYMYQFPRVVA